MKFSVKFNNLLLTFACVCVCASVIFAQPARNQGRREDLSRSDFPPGTKFVALTFDDGPNTTYTVQVLDELKRLGAHASFYIQGQKVNPQTIPILQRMVHEGHDIDNHSWNHPSFGQDLEPGTIPQITTAVAARDQLRRTSQAIFDAVGFWPFSFRAPFLEWGTFAWSGIDVLAGLDREMAMAFIDTGIDPADFNNQGNPQGIASNILGRSDAVLDGGIILLHDCGGPRHGTVASLQLFIPQLRQRGFEIVTVRELFMIMGNSPELFGGLWGGSAMWPRVNQRADLQNTHTTPTWRTDGITERLFSEDWMTRDWWTCSTAPWDRDLSQPCDPSQQRFTVSFNTVGGSAVSSASVVGGSTVNRPADPTRDNSAFDTWLLNGTPFDFSTPITASITLVARWNSVGGGQYQEVIGWTWDGGQITWTSRADAHDRNSSANISNQNPLTAALHVGINDTISRNPNVINWTWANVSAFFTAGLFNNLTGVEITYTSNLPAMLTIGSTARLGDDAVVYSVELPASATQNTLMFSLSDFEAPQWMWDWDNADAGTIRYLNDVAKANIISGLEIAHENRGETLNITVSSIKLHGISGGNPSVIPSSRNVSRTSGNALAINSFNAGNLNLNVSSAGMYNVSIHDISGRVLAQTSASLTAGANSLQLGQNIARGVVIVRVQGANATLTRRISIR
ncbi:MAG: polysaccharide deacetylase family protein [Chitinivibrionia bacterium]|nr:polysaccharide deacetylase family protein [Chitinivibrionia bacterium]